MSIRNNEARLGTSHKNSDPAPPIENEKVESEQEVSQPPLSFSTPTEFVDLPSKGLYYPQGHILHGESSVEIRYMTARDEDILTSKSLLKKGIAIDRFLQNIIVNKGINVDDLLVGDKNALVVAARITGYGANYETKVMCPSCGEHAVNSFDLETCSKKESVVPDGVDKTQNGTFVAITPKTGHQVELRLLTGIDEKRLAKIVASKKKRNLPESVLTDQLRLAIASVNGSSEMNLINLFVASLTAFEARALRDIYAQLAPNIEMKQDFVCHSCGFEQEMEVPFTSDFFWPKR
tara:strand:- start:401 stop:1276 length:876 start_codon:yes stop_codon:yes gene_type:complete